MNNHSMLARSIKTALFVSTAAITSSVIAQETIEEVEVVGIRASMENAIDTKRNSDTLVESISAEDVGKFPDKNVAESLSRLSSVSVDRSFGEGEKITIRGSGPDFNRTLLNGQTVATADWFMLDDPSRSFNYTLLPSTLVSSLVVHKTPKASIDEGSLGGTVDVKTRRPLDMKANEVQLALGANYGEKSGETDPTVSGLYSWKNEDETLGFLISAVDQQYTVQREGFEVLGWQDQNENGISTPTTMGAPQFIQERDLNTYFGSFQFRASDALLISFDGLYSKLDSDNQNSNWLTWTGASDAATETLQEQNGIIQGNTLVGLNGQAKEGVNFINRVSSTETESYTLTFEYETDAIEVDFKVGTTQASGGTYRETSWEYVQADGSFDYDLAKPSLNINPTATDAEAFDAGWIWGGEKPTTDEEDYAQVDFYLPVTFGPITSIEFGAKYRDAKRTQDRKAYSWHGPNTIDSDLAGSYLDWIFQECPTLASCGLDAEGTISLDAPVSGNITDQLAQNRPVMENIAFEGLNGVAADYAISRVLSENWEVTEETVAAFIQANFEHNAISGNIGVRYVTTDQASSGWEFSADSWGFDTLDRDWLTPSELEWVTVDNSYSEFLPSLNVSYKLTDDQIIRAAAARVMARQNWADLSPYETWNALGESNPTGTAGNPDLKPYFANKMDVSYEYYYGSASMLSAALYYSNQSSYKDTSTYVKPIYDQATDQYVDVTFSQPENGPGGEVTGIELSIQHDFGGYGLQANYSYADASSDNPNFDGKIPGVSDHTANLVGYYENDILGARLMYNYRTEYYNGKHWNGFDISTEDYGQLDAALTWYATEYLQIDLQAQNLTNEEVRQYSESKERLVSLYENGARYALTARFQF